MEHLPLQADRPWLLLLAEGGNFVSLRLGLRLGLVASIRCAFVVTSEHSS